MKAVGLDQPLFAARGEGAYLEDAEGRRYVDWVLSWGPLNFGHADPEAVESVIEGAACVFVEPVAGNRGVVPPADGFLEGLRRLCNESGALLVFDEVITGFRVARGGAQERYGVLPDLTVLGKIVGGGLS